MDRFVIVRPKFTATLASTIAGAAEQTSSSLNATNEDSEGMLTKLWSDFRQYLKQRELSSSSGLSNFVTWSGISYSFSLSGEWD
jgi:hypothetical protein